jgi:hypothetical protein
MTVHGTWQVTGGGGRGTGGGIGVAVLVVAAAAVAVKLAGPAVAAVGELVRVALITAGVVAGVAVAAVAGLVAVRVHRRALPGPPQQRVLPARAPWQVDAAQPRQIEAGRELHLHLHDVSAEDVAAILRKGDER